MTAAAQLEHEGFQVVQLSGKGASELTVTSSQLGPLARPGPEAAVELSCHRRMFCDSSVCSLPGLGPRGRARFSDCHGYPTRMTRMMAQEQVPAPGPGPLREIVGVRVPGPGHDRHGSSLCTSVTVAVTDSMISTLLRPSVSSALRVSDRRASRFAGAGPGPSQTLFIVACPPGPD